MSMPLRYQANPRDPWPKLLMFSVMKPAYLRDHAAEWAGYGFRGALLHVGDWSQDIWAVDGDPATVGRQDAFFEEVASCNRVAKPLGIDSNFITFAFYRPLPNWFDDIAWQAKAARYEQTAAFARTTGCRGVAVDMEYVAEQYHFDHEGNRRYSEDALRVKARARGAQLAQALLRGFPDLELLVLPEGPVYLGPLGAEMIGGMLGALAARKAPGGLHLLSEGTYTQTDVRWLISAPFTIEGALWPYLSPQGRRYWREKCSVALGQWPLSADQERRDEQGNVVRRSNDKQPNFTLEQFRHQTAACRMVSKRYHWIYMHGAAWWSLTPEEATRYPGSGDAVPPVANIAQYREVTAQGLILDNDELEEFAGLALAGQGAGLNRRYGAVPEWWVIGPFDNTDGKGFHTAYPPEKHIDLRAAHRGKSGLVRWKLQQSSPPFGVIILHTVFRRQPWVLAYAACWVKSDHAQTVQLRLGSDDDVVVWLGSREVWRNEGVRGLTPDEDIVPVSLPPGVTPLLVKVCQRRGDWGFALRLTDEDGRAARNVTFLTKPPS